MHATHRTTRIAALGAGLFVLSASAAGAQQQRPLLQWRGQVDREVEIVMRGSDVSTRYAGGERSGSRARAQGSIPYQDGYVTVQTQRGRGRVDVVQQPTSSNGYTTIVRVLDPQPGADVYQLHAFWQPAYASDGSYGGQNGRYGREDEGSYGRHHRRGHGNDAQRGDDDDDDRGASRGGYGRGDDDGYGRGGQDQGGYGRGGQDQGGYGQGGYGRGGYGNGAGYGNGTLHWSGNVDDAIDIRIQGNRVDYATVSGSPAYGVRSQISGGALGQGARISVRENSGRGSVMVLQQPSAQNGYTALVRVMDRASGAGYYDLDISW